MSRETFLAAVRKAKVPEKPMPDLASLPKQRFDDPLATFQSVLEFVGGRFERVASVDEIRGRMTGHGIVLDHTANGGKIETQTDPSQVNPHENKGIDLLIFNGVVAVAESAAIWVTEKQVKDPASLFLAQHMAIAIREEDLVHNLHEAYEKLATQPVPRFGVFISGPSKTADIEQCLVIGAHGARSLTIFLVG